MAGHIVMRVTTSPEERVILPESHTLVPVRPNTDYLYDMSVGPTSASVTEFPVESPCIKVCRLDGAQRCFGCGRSLDEIAGWSRMSADQRRAVNERLGFRGHGVNR